jgi:phage terminase large subunit-like protein
VSNFKNDLLGGEGEDKGKRGCEWVTNVGNIDLSSTAASATASTTTTTTEIATEGTPFGSIELSGWRARKTGFSFTVLHSGWKRKLALA